LKFRISPSPLEFVEIFLDSSCIISSRETINKMTSHATIYMNSRFIEYLACLQHSDIDTPLSLDPLHVINDRECLEGFLICSKCGFHYPIIQGVAIIVKDFTKYVGGRLHTFLELLKEIKTDKMKKFLMDYILYSSIGNARIYHSIVDAKNTIYEENGIFFHPFIWAQNEHSDPSLYYDRRPLKPIDFYNNILDSIKSNLNGSALEIGCSIGYFTSNLAKKFSFAFGMDLSFSFIREARKRISNEKEKNLEFYVADILQPPFNSMIFDTIVALNLIQHLRPADLLSSVCQLLKPNGDFILTETYDPGNEQLTGGVITPTSLRALLLQSGFSIDNGYKIESYIPWVLKIYERAYIFYLVDLIRAKKISTKG
jgi:SAM-dependent methyltransferase/uncharacterized protein YbaR (Trm112 family)